MNATRMNHLKVLTATCVLMLASMNVSAETWRRCDVYDSVASQRDAAIALGKMKKRISLFKKSDYAMVTIYFDEKTFGSADLMPTGRRVYGDGRMYVGYADKSNTMIVQEFESSDNIMVTSRGDVEFTLFATCK